MFDLVSLANSSLVRDQCDEDPPRQHLTRLTCPGEGGCPCQGREGAVPHDSPAGGM